jgi:hypothetical protein
MHHGGRQRRRERTSVGSGIRIISVSLSVLSSASTGNRANGPYLRAARPDSSFEEKPQSASHERATPGTQEASDDPVYGPC